MTTGLQIDRRQQLLKVKSTLTEALAQMDEPPAPYEHREDLTRRLIVAGLDSLDSLDALVADAARANALAFPLAPEAGSK